MSKQIKIRPGLQTLSLVSLIAACSGGEVDLGGSTIAQNVERGSRCSESTIVDESVKIASQFEGTDLTPLGSLRNIDGHFHLGVYPELELLDEMSLDAWRAEFARIEQIVDAGWLTSLAGVEALQQVGGLTLVGISAPNLEAFESLRRMNGDMVGAVSGALNIRGAKNLVDLSGLENVRGIRWLEMNDNESFESLDGLQLSTQMQHLWLSNMPALTDIDALAPVEFVAALVYLDNTGVTSLDGLASLQTVVEDLALFNNAELTNVDSLDSLYVVNSLVFSGNPKLTHLPEFAGLVGIDGFEAYNNAELTRIALNFPSLISFNIVQDSDVPTSAGVIEIGDNPKLATLSFESGFSSAEVLAVYRNDSLTRLDLGSLQKLDRLSINGNAALAEVALGELQTVDSLFVYANPLLSTAGLQTVRTFEREFAENGDDPAP
jgi:hypothetical protein